MNKVWTQLKNIFSLIFLLGVGVLLRPEGAEAFFSNLETAPAQQFQASSLQLESVSLPSSVTLSSDNDPNTFLVNINTVSGSVPALYDVELTTSGPAADWCNSLFISATSTNNNFYNAPAGGFTSSAEADFGSWQFAIYSDDISSAPVGTACTLAVKVSTWQDNLSKGVGYQDTQTVEIEVLVGDEISTFETLGFAVEESAASKPAPEGRVKGETDEVGEGASKENQPTETKSEEAGEEESAETSKANEGSENTEKSEETIAEDKEDGSINETKPEETELAHEQTHELTHEQTSETETETETEEEEEKIEDDTPVAEAKESEPEPPVTDEDKADSPADIDNSVSEESGGESETDLPEQDNQADTESEEVSRKEESEEDESKDEPNPEDV